MQQVRCDNCGGYRVTDEMYVLDSSSKHVTPSKVSTDHEFAVMITGVGVLLAVFGIGIPILIWGIVSLNKASALKKLMEAGPHHHNYACLICGATWTDTEPYSASPAGSITGSPSLLQMGAQRLEEEEEQRRRMAYGAQLRREEEQRKKEGN